ncbi:MAG: transcriptional regulator [Verrucomicrobiales bacterium]|nr:transcriptional regulator [Verrucomicrobiales bacterium]
MLSQTVEYALRAMVYLASAEEEVCPVDEVAEGTKVPPSYLSKVLQNLNRAGLVQSKRGLQGGYHLSKDPTETTILDVVNAVEPIERIHTCPLELKSHGTNLCPLHRRLDSAMAEVERAFGTTTLQELITDPSPSVPLCDFPCPKRSTGAE